MKKAIPLVVLAAMVLAACGGGSGAVAASVDGEDITVNEIEALILPGEESTIAKEQFAEMLGFEIQQRILVSAAESDLGIVIGDEEITAEADAIVEEFNTTGGSREDFLTSSGVTEELLLRVAHQRLLQTQIRDALAADVEEPTREEIDGAITEAEAAYCASHILVATQEEATAVVGRLEAGEPFADLAAELSTDTGSGAVGGDLGCGPSTQYVTEFADALTSAEVGVPTDPVETEFGFHIILLRNDEIPDEAVLVEQMKTTAIDTATNTWLLEQVEAAEVTVDESFGTWDGETSQVVPPTE